MKRKAGQKLHNRLFMYLTFSIVMTIFVLSGVLYFNFEKIAVDQVHTYALGSLAQSRSNVAVMTESAKTISNQIFRDVNIANLLYSNPDIYQLTPAIRQLENYRLSMPFIDSIYVINNRSGVIYVSINDSIANMVQQKADFKDRRVIDIIDHFRDYKPFYPIPRTLDLVEAEQDLTRFGTKDYYTYFCYNAFASNLDCAIIVNVSADWIYKVVQGNAETGDLPSGDTFLIDAKGVLVSPSTNHPLGTSLAGRDYITKILEDQNAAGYLTSTVEGVKSVITYTEPDFLGWRYVRVTPFKLLMTRINGMKGMTVLFGLLVLLIGLGISYVSANHLYRPIKGIITELSMLQRESRRNILPLRENLLRGLIHDRNPGTTTQIEKRFKELDVRLDAEGHFRIVLIRLDHYRNFQQENMGDECDLMKFAILNIATEVCEDHFAVAGADVADDSMALFVNMTKNASTPLLMECLRNIQQLILQHLDLSVTCTISPEGDTALCLGSLFEKAREASLHRFFLGHGTLISADVLIGCGETEYVYPEHKESQLRDELKLGRLDAVRKLYLEIVGETASYPFSVVNYAISRLTLNVNSTLEVIQRNSVTIDNSYLGGLTPFLENIETLNEVNRMFFDRFDEIDRRTSEKKNTKHQDLVAGVDTILNRDYRKQDLSLESVAGELGMTPGYLARLYKQHSLQTILERILSLRMEKAKEYLATTDLTIADVAVRTGFSNDTYFYKTFRKETGVTPNEYRSTHKTA